jgi:hypothetical protein
MQIIINVLPFIDQIVKSSERQIVGVLWYLWRGLLYWASSHYMTRIISDEIQNRVLLYMKQTQKHFTFNELSDRQCQLVFHYLYQCIDTVTRCY